MYEEDQQKYTQQLLQDLNIGQLNEDEQKKALEIISERFQNVILYTTLSALNNEQKKAFSDALDLKPPEKENKLIEVTSLVPNLKDLIDEALEHEYESLKYSMSK
jgi:hypothetical protein